MTSTRQGVSIRDVARAAQVSPTTVSHALGGKRPVAESTRRRVIETAARLGYRPHPGARSLKAAGAGVLGLCLVNVTGGPMPVAEMEYYFRLINAATQAALDEHLALVVVPDTGDGEFLDRLLLDGAVVADPLPADANLRRLRARGLPCVTIGREPDAPAEGYWVDSDTERATIEALDHLAARGARDVAALTWDTGDFWTQSGLGAYRRWCADHDRPARVTVIAEDTTAAIDAAVAALLDAEPRPDAVYVLYELPALALHEAAGRRGLDVPGELMIVAPGDFGAGAARGPSLTTLDYHPDELGRAAAAMLVDLVRGREPATPRLIVPATLIEGESTRRLPVRT